MSNSTDVDRGYFERLFDASEDPWAYQRRWYEARKRALTLACLPAARYATAYEPGCANGELSAALADRCDALLVSDGTEQAVALARRRLAARPGVTVERRWVPEEWPPASFDLVVLSEFCYYLSGPSLHALTTKVRQSLNSEGTVVACHWRHPIQGCEGDGDMVHAMLNERLGLPRLGGYSDFDLRIDVWRTDPRSVGQLENLHP